MTAMGRIVPVLRMFDIAKARDFYLDFLGFSLDFEHRFADNVPLYMGVSRDGCSIHLSEHHGDVCPGSHIRIETHDISALAIEMSAKDYRYAKPGPPIATPWGTRELTVTDPFGNRLTFTQAV